MSRQSPRIVFLGSPEFAVPSLEALVSGGYPVVGVFTQPDRPAGRGGRMVSPPVKQAAERLDVPVHQPAVLRGREATRQLRELAPDLLVVAAFGQILRPAVLEIPAFGTLNVHASLLPRHRGASPVTAAILAGEDETGVSIMVVDAGLDTGPVVARRRVPIQESDTSGTLTAALSRLGAALLVETLPGWLGRTAVAEPQDETLATYAPILTKDVARIDWTKAAQRIAREVRAYNPWPLSFTSLGTETLQILESRAVAKAADGHVAEPGTIVTLDGLLLPPQERPRAGFAVATGADLLIPLTLRRAGRSAISGAEFARGARDLVGRSLV